MAVETDTDKNAASSNDGVATVADGEPPKKYPKGVVLGKDGKPCRSCTSGAAFSAWASQTKSTLKTQASSSVPVSRKDCPPDVEQLGRSSWTLLHSIAATYPTNPTPTEQSDVTNFMKLFAKLYPCWVCAEDFQKYIEKEKIKAGSRNEFGNWLCEAHNAVNRKLGKPTFDCRFWEERWKDGWRDGRCD